MLRVLSLALISLSLTGCALALKGSLADKDLAKTRHVGVVSSLGDTFEGATIGWTIFNNDFFSESVADWQIDQYASGAATVYLKTNPRFETSLFSLDSSARAKLAELRPTDDHPIWQVAQQQGFDTLVAIRPAQRETMGFPVSGYGYFERSRTPMAPLRCVYASFKIDVYDVATRQLIAWEWGGAAPCRLVTSYEVPFRKPMKEYSPSEIQSLRDNLQNQMNSGMREALTKLALVPPAAPPN